jgi:UDP-N-acetyl-D-mannosaminuronic acid dehydrogenase
MIRTAREVNTYKAEWVLEKIKNATFIFENEQGRKAKVACMGLVFKPDIDDLRESPVLYITKRLIIADGLHVIVAEPNIKNHKEFEIVNFQEAIKEADIITFLVAHKEFKDLHLNSGLNFCGVFKN